MIRPLRQWHRRQILALGLILPVGLVLGLAGRKSVPTNPVLPAALTPAMPALGPLAWQSEGLFSANIPVMTRVWRSVTGTGVRAVSFFAPADFIEPDLMVYWHSGPAGLTETLPTNAILLGAFGSKALTLPDEVAQASGVLVLYSLADGEVVDVSKPFQFDNFISDTPNPPTASP
jgi:hypothetical protein